MWAIKGTLIIALFGLVKSPAMATPEDGAALYKKHCETCHQADGWGIPFMAAPLVDSSTVNGDGDYMAWVVVKGTASIEGWVSDYANPMPSFKTLNDSELAAVLSYVRATYGTNKNEVTMEQVARARARGD